MYDELIKSLREAPNDWYDAQLHYDAAAALESLERSLRSCRNELCLKCGEYRERYLGACNGCRWKDV